MPNLDRRHEGVKDLKTDSFVLHPGTATPTHKVTLILKDGATSFQLAQAANAQILNLVYVDYAPLKITSAYDSDNPFNNEIKTVLQGLQPKASEIKLDDYQLSPLPNSKHVKANLGYTKTGMVL